MTSWWRSVIVVPSLALMAGPGTAKQQRDPLGPLPGSSPVTVIQVAPPLICGPAEFDEMEAILRHTLLEAQTLV